MRFHAEGPVIPDILLERCDTGRVVFLCGAGVSLPSGMPTFVDLTQYVIEYFDPPHDSEIMAAFRPWLHNQSSANIPLDQIFNLLHLEYGKDEVNALVTKRLSASQPERQIGFEHALIKRISSNQSGVPQIVTTNFDRLFEVGIGQDNLTRYVPPAFPNINFGSTIEGITYLHGRLVDASAVNHPYVLSSADFGRAYLSEGWATSFIKLLLERYIVVLVGYQAEDPPVKYLLQGLNHDGQYDRSRLYAFDCGLAEEIEAKWRDRGVTAIAYPDHPALWKSMEAWAQRADDPRRWRASVIAKSQQDPKIMAPHERGQVAHILRTAQGARLFSEAIPRPHPEWICVMDANIRSAKKNRIYSEFSEEEVFDPQAIYGLDDDLKDISDDERKRGISNDSLLEWRDEDDNPSDYHRLAGGFETIPKRLGHLLTWFSESLDSPIMAWWAIRKIGLHPLLLQKLERNIEFSASTHKRARYLWSLILEHHKDPRNRRYDVDWYDLKARIKTQGWTAGVLREFRRVMAPRLEMKSPYGLGEVRPPSDSWEEIHFSKLGQFEVVFTNRHDDDLDVPDNVLLQVFSALEEQLIIAAGILEDIETFYFPSPSCYPERAVEGEEYSAKGADVLTWFVQLFDRVAEKWPELASAHVTTWPVTEPFIFRKLRLYALSKTGVFGADRVAEEVLSIEQNSFWDTKITRELLFLLVDRWEELPQENQNRIIERILTGPYQIPYFSEEELPKEREVLAAKYARYLELNGCELATIYRDRLTAMIKRIPDWNDRWATSVVISWGSRSGWVSTDEKPDVISVLPVNEIIPKVKEEQKRGREDDNFTRKRPFIGLIKENPRKALSALTIAGKNDDYPKEFWSPMISELPVDIKPRLRRVFLNRIARLPVTTIVELRHTLSSWLEQNLVGALKFDYGLGWAVYDHVIEGLLIGGVNATKSGFGEVIRNGEAVIQSRRTFSHAINGPVGKCTQALFQAIPGEETEAGSLIPDSIKYRLERLFTAPGEGADHAIAITTRNLNWLMFVDPVWAKEWLIPILDLKHPAAEPAWNGYLHSEGMPSIAVAELIKPSFLNLFTWLEHLSWEKDLSSRASQWLGLMRMFHPDEPSSPSRNEMRSILRSISDEARNHFISWLGRVGQKNDNGWIKHVIPLINEDWPKERGYRTTTSVKAWIDLLDGTGDNFPAVYDAVKILLVPIETFDHLYYRFTRELAGKDPITLLFPETTLDLMDRIIPPRLTRPSDELQKILGLIEETEPSLIKDSRYLRLIELVEKS